MNGDPWEYRAERVRCDSCPGGRVLFVQKVAVSLLHRSIDDSVAGLG
jgi:hypothetical protein